MEKTLFHGAVAKLDKKTKIKKLRNMILCESHRDKTMYYLKKESDD
jgi:hypothetical protein